MKLKKITATLLLTLIGLLLFTACGAPAETKKSFEESGVLVLKVNPEIAVEYNEEGLVTAVTGRNEDGNKILAEYSDYLGKTSSEVVQELVLLIGEEGYFISEIENESRTITLEIEPNSYVPTADFLDEIAEDVSELSQEMDGHPEVLSITETGETRAALTQEEALAAALSHAGLSKEDVGIAWAGDSSEDDTAVYVFEFYHKAMRYDYKIKKMGGEVLSFSSRHKGDLSPEDWNENPNDDTTRHTSESLLPLEDVKNIAFADAGVQKEQAQLVKAELDHDDGYTLYEIDFFHDAYKYEYDIDAYTGDILSREKEHKGESKATPKEQENQAQSRPTDTPEAFQTTQSSSLPLNRQRLSL